MEWGRREYKVLIRPFRNSDQTVMWEWRKADPRDGTLGFPSRICSLDWATQPWIAEGVGEVYGADRTFIRKPLMGPVPGKHICGTEDEFRNGEILDLTRPLTVYLPSGLPVCCDLFRREAVPRLGFDPFVIRNTTFATSPKPTHAVNAVQQHAVRFAHVARPTSSDTAVSQSRTYYPTAARLTNAQTALQQHAVRFATMPCPALGFTPVASSFTTPPIDTTTRVDCSHTPIVTSSTRFAHTSVAECSHTPVAVMDFESGGGGYSFTNGTLDTTADSYRCSTADGLWCSQKFTPPSSVTLVEFTVWFNTDVGESPNSIAWKIGTTANASDIDSGTASGVFTYLGTDALGFDEWKVVVAISVPVTAGDRWLTVTNIAPGTVSGGYWYAATGGTLPGSTNGGGVASGFYFQIRS